MQRILVITLVFIFVIGTWSLYASQLPIAKQLPLNPQFQPPHPSQSKQPSKLELRYDWLWGWQFKKDGKWYNVGLFASELRRAVSDVEEAVEVINEINIISAGLYLVAAAGGVFTTLSVRCWKDYWGNEHCNYGPGYMLGILLSGIGHFGKQMIQGIYFDKAIRIYNKAKGLG